MIYKEGHCCSTLGSPQLIWSGRWKHRLNEIISILIPIPIDLNDRAFWFRTALLWRSLVKLKPHWIPPLIPLLIWKCYQMDLHQLWIGGNRFKQLCHDPSSIFEAFVMKMVFTIVCWCLWWWCCWWLRWSWWLWSWWLWSWWRLWRWWWRFEDVGDI